MIDVLAPYVGSDCNQALSLAAPLEVKKQGHQSVVDALCYQIENDGGAHPVHDPGRWFRLTRRKNQLL
jgi:hypothetical protein